MTQISPLNDPKSRPQRLIIGGIIGSLFGLLGAYFYSRAVEDDVRQNGTQRNPVSTGEIIGLGLAVRTKRPHIINSYHPSLVRRVLLYRKPVLFSTVT